MRVPPLVLTVPRLTLIAGTSELARMETNDRLHFARLLNASIPESWPLPLGDAQSMKPELVGWGEWYFVRSEGLVAVGGGAFKGMPTADGTVEVGYSVLPEYQGRGYATGAVGAMVEWALGQPAVTRVIAETLPQYPGSIRVLEKLGFNRVAGGSGGGVIQFERRRDQQAIPRPVAEHIDQKERAAMMTNTSEDGETSRAVLQEQRKDSQRKRRELTCSEAEVEAILSEGEST